MFVKALEQFEEYPQRVGEIFNQFVSAAVDSDLTHARPWPHCGLFMLRSKIRKDRASIWHYGL